MSLIEGRLMPDTAGLPGKGGGTDQARPCSSFPRPIVSYTSSDDHLSPGTTSAPASRQPSSYNSSRGTKMNQAFAVFAAVHASECS